MTRLKKYGEVFQNKLGTEYKVNWWLRKVLQTSLIPYVIRGTIEKDLECLKSLWVIEKSVTVIRPHLLFPFLKQTALPQYIPAEIIKSILILFSRLINFQCPKTEDLFAALTGGKLWLNYRTFINKSCLSRKYVTINTHRGLYQCNRLPFGVASAQKQTMDTILKGLPRVVVYINDILITGHTNEEHLKNLEKVLACLQQYGLRDKCFLFQLSVEYLGYITETY